MSLPHHRYDSFQRPPHTAPAAAAAPPVHHHRPPAAQERKERNPRNGAHSVRLVPPTSSLASSINTWPRPPPPSPWPRPPPPITANLAPPTCVHSSTFIYTSPPSNPTRPESLRNYLINCAFFVVLFLFVLFSFFHCLFLCKVCLHDL